jgi:hypothetical protein
MERNRLIFISEHRFEQYPGKFDIHLLPASGIFEATYVPEADEVVSLPVVRSLDYTEVVRDLTAEIQAAGATFRGKYLAYAITSSQVPLPEGHVRRPRRGTDYTDAGGLYVNLRWAVVNEFGYEWTSTKGVEEQLVYEVVESAATNKAIFKERDVEEHRLTLPYVLGGFEENVVLLPFTQQRYEMLKQWEAALSVTVSDLHYFLRHPDDETPD